MTEALFHLVSGLPTWLATMILAAVPLTELQLAIPIAIHRWSIPPFEAFGWALLGNMLPFLPVFYGLMALRKMCERYVPGLVRPIDNLIAYGEKKVKDKYEQYGAIALFLFVAIPLPLSGIWSATLAAVALKIPLKKAFIAIFFGMLVAGFIVTMASIAGGEILTQ